MTLATRRDPKAIARSIPASNAKALGSIAGTPYVELDGREYAVGEKVELDHRRGPGDIILAEPFTELVDGTPFRGTRYTIARPVRNGTFAALSAKATRKREAIEEKRRARPVDMLGRQPFLARVPESVLAFPGGPARDPLPLGPVDEAMAGALLRSVSPAKTIIRDSQPAARGRAILERFAAKGIDLSLLPSGRVLAKAPGGTMAPGVVDALREAHRLIVGELTGHAVFCELPHDGSPPTAETIVVLDVAACQACADGSER